MDKNPTIENAIAFLKEIESICSNRHQLSSGRMELIAKNHRVDNRLFYALIRRGDIVKISDRLFHFDFKVDDGHNIIALAIDDMADERRKSKYRASTQKQRKIHKRDGGAPPPNQPPLF